MEGMNRRTFLQSLAVSLTLPAVPALSLKPAPAALPAAASPATASASAAALASKARFWAIYMHGVQGYCTPATLGAMLSIPEAEAKSHVTRLVAEGVIRPNPLLRKPVAKVVKQTVKRNEGDGVLGKMEEYVGWQWEDEGDATNNALNLPANEADNDHRMDFFPIPTKMV